MLLKFLIAVTDVKKVDQYKKLFHLLILYVYVYIYGGRLKASSFPYKIRFQLIFIEKF